MSMTWPPEMVKMGTTYWPAVPWQAAGYRMWCGLAAIATAWRAIAVPIHISYSW